MCVCVRKSRKDPVERMKDHLCGNRGEKKKREEKEEEEAEKRRRRGKRGPGRVALRGDSERAEHSKHTARALGVNTLSGR